MRGHWPGAADKHGMDRHVGTLSPHMTGSATTPACRADLREQPQARACYVARMSEPTTIQALRAFVAERDWSQFHSPENLAKSISIEAGELLECFQWKSEFDRERVLGELADVMTYCFLLADRLGVEPDAVVLDKLAATAKKYPIEKARGTSDRYDTL